ncbi:MAG TPA: hypothetical protein VGQ90_02325 [Stellaceae bacterium]|nr:hypothetical protein [Stellaceae bacterium]
MANDATSFFNDAEARAADWLAAWDGQGIHRTATAGDEAGARWLAAEARALGAAVTIEDVALDRLDPVAAYLEIGGERINGVPVFDAPASDAQGVVGRLGPVGGGDIVVAELTARAVYSGKFERLRRTPGHRGFVVVCAGDNPGLGLINAENFRRPYGAPAIHVSSEARDRVMAAMASGMPARLVADSRRTPSTGRNVVAAFPGDTGRPPLVVITPRSSWWQSTSERGGGIVCWLESLRALVAAPPSRPVVFTANCGHELGHLGLDDFIARRPGWDRPLTEAGATWILYGANIGAAGGTLAAVSPHDDLRRLAASELTRDAQPHDLAPKDFVPSGETRDIQRSGGHCLALNGSNPLFHLPQDRWPHSVDTAAIARIAAAGARIVQALSR